ncbi:hypothetical protein F4808DRAFT_439604 [Astrocystis sublimbata]|nr:hypothetical protein F4808DRAFT_439585 [Astrocystis sublimbata]KAI0196904.1 hypothetical protein F4808DRAFT_439604 [Astrocystis sublimbata]
MKYFTLLASLLPVVTAAPSPPKVENFQASVSNFTTGTVGFGNGAWMMFNFVLPDIVSAHCQYFSFNTGPQLPGVGQRACDNPAVSWAFTIPSSNEGTARLIVSFAPPLGGVTTGFYQWSTNTFPVQQVGSAEQVIYTGPDAFPMNFAP